MGREEKYVYIAKDVHHKLSLIKLYGDLQIHVIASNLLRAALESDILEKILMKELGDKVKVEHILKYLRKNT